MPEINMEVQLNNDIKEDIAKFMKKLRILDLKHKAETAKTWEQIRLVRKICPHTDTKYFPDPSGNNDSYHRCNICGKEAKRLHKRKK